MGSILRATLVVSALLTVVGCAGLSMKGSSSRGAKQGWTQWRGPDRSGISIDEELLESWPEGGPALLWKTTDLGSGYSAVSVSNGRIYTQGKRDDASWVFAIDAADGSEIWTRQIGSKYSNKRGGGPRGTPTLVGDRLYALSGNGDLVCLATDDGEQLWHVNILERFGTENLKWGISESPLVDRDHVIVATGSADGSIVAFDRSNGEIVWQSEGLTDEPGYASALVENVGGVRQIIHFTDKAAVGVRASDGKPLWRYEKAANDVANCTTPLYHDGRVFVTSAYDTGAALLRLTSQGSETTAEEVYFTREMMNHHGGVVLIDGYVYGFSNKNLVCIDFETGERMWRDKSVGKGSVAAADGKLYIQGQTGIVGLVEATPEAYREISRFEIEQKKTKSWAHPVITGGRLYIRNRDELLAYDLRP